MKITNIVVRAGRTFNHPHESYSNLKPEVELSATIEEGDDTQTCVRELQAKAEGMVEDHKRGLLNSIEELYQLTEAQQQVRGLQSEIERAQASLDTLRTRHPELKLLGQ